MILVTLVPAVVPSCLMSSLNGAASPGTVIGKMDQVPGPTKCLMIDPMGWS
jgi:hypothetical protein